MPNNYFQLKQFTVQQDKCAMKVCTDACLFGSLIPALPGPGDENVNILDIGTGTGLLALMCAQQNNNAIVDAVEIDGDAAAQAAQNFTASPWGGRLSVHHTSIQQFALSTVNRYDLIISNPPFFEDDLKSLDAKRNLALHSEALSLEELILSVDRLLNPAGVFGVLLPYHRTVYFEALTKEKGFYPSQKILVKQTPKHAFFRSILFLKKIEVAVTEEEIIIKDSANLYTARFVELLKDYYLQTF